MCGICGFVSKRTISLEQLKEMNDTMCHRGPDDNGEEIMSVRKGYYLGLAQRRLSIQDLSPLGHQPMHSCNGRVSIVFNGEIYNFKELKEELKDYPFRSNCDTEVILAAYFKWGIECIKRLNGMFAISLYDRDQDTLYLVRDRIGKKPLYYELDGENLYFSSELKPLMKRPGFVKEIRTEVLPRFLYQQYICSPDTIFKNVYKLEPGSILEFKLGIKKQYSYWSIKEIYHEMQKYPVSDYEEAKDTLKNLLKRSVASRMIADVPLGAFLSGGYDSSLMTAIAQELSKEPVKTFSIGFHEKRYNEAGYAKEVATYLGTKHTELYIDEAEMYKMVETLPRYYDEPFADSSQIPSMLVSGLAKKDVTVALSGDGGDEFFCGYNSYINVDRAGKLDLAGRLTDSFLSLPGIRQLPIKDKLPFKVKVIVENRDQETKTQLGSYHYLSRAQKMVLGEAMSCRYPVESAYQEKNWQIRRMLLDMDTYLPDDILCKVDRASMKYSLETRCPILDREVMEYSFRLPHSFKFDGGTKKKILKEIAYDYIPRELLDRPKVGFSVPLDKWLRGPLKEQLLSVCSGDYLKKQGIFNADFTQDMIKNYLNTGDGGPSTGENYSKLTWSFFAFQQWYQYYLE